MLGAPPGGEHRDSLPRQLLGSVEHAVDVTADSLFEADAVAVKAFREGALVEELSVPGAELRIRSRRFRSRTEFVYNAWNGGGTVGAPAAQQREVLRLMGMLERMRERPVCWYALKGAKRGAQSAGTERRCRCR